MNTKRIVLKNQNAVNSLDICSKTNIIVVGQQGDMNGSSCVTLLDGNNFSVFKQLEYENYANIDYVRFLSIDNFIAYVKNKSDVLIYDFSNDLYKECELISSSIDKISSSRNANRIAISGITIDVWDWLSCKRIWSLPNYVLLDGDDSIKATADISADGKKIAIVAQENKKAVIWDIDNNYVFKKLLGAPAKSHQTILSNNMHYLVCIGYLSHGVFLWDLNNNCRHMGDIINIEMEGFWCMCFDPDSEFLVLGSLSGFIAVFDLKKENMLALAEMHRGQIQDIKFSVDGKSLISISEDGELIVSDFKQLCDNNRI